MRDRDDGRLWRDARLGDSAAFGELFERHASRIHSYCLRRTGDWALAEDMTATTFLSAWRRRNIDLAPHQVLPWLYGVATNVLRNSRRSRRRFAAALARMPREGGLEFVDAADDRVTAEQRVHELLSAIGRLPKPEQDAIALVWWQELTPAQAAFALGVPEATVRTRLHRARRRLLVHMEEPLRRPEVQGGGTT